MTGRYAPSLRALQTLEAVVRAGSLTRAAAELAISVSAVSFQLREVERSVGRRLVARHGSRLAIDPKAEALARELTPAFETITRISARLKHHDRSTRISISMLPSFAAIWFLPRLYRLQARMSDVEIQVVTGTALVDFDAEPIDCAIRCGKGVWAGLRATPLFAQRFAPVANRAYLERSGRLQSPRDLGDHPLIIMHRGLDEWLEWCAAAGVNFPAEPRRHRVDSRDLALAAVRTGLGIGLLDVSLVAAELASGELVQLFPTEFHDGSSHYLVTPELHADQPVLIRLRDWLLEESGRGFQSS